MQPLLLRYVPYSSSEITLAEKTQQTVQIPLNSYFNNKGFGLVPGEANFDQLNNSYPAVNLPTGGTYVSTKTNISYILSGQQIAVPSTSYFSLQMLVATESASGTGNMTFTYTDGTSTLAEVRSNPYSSFLSILKGEIVMPSYYTINTTNFNTSHIFEYVGPVDPSKTLSSITLPDTSNDTSRIHLFSMSLFQQTGIQVQFVRPTQKHSIERIQAVEVVLNSANEWISGEGVQISITGAGIETIEPGFIKRMRPGDQKKVDVGVIGCGNITATVTLTGSVNATYIIEGVQFGLEEYSSELESLSKHESPDW
jgi:alpha-L-fucosidase